MVNISLDPEILNVRSSCNFDLVLAQLFNVVQRAPRTVIRENLCSTLQRAEIHVVVEHVWEDHLSREVDWFSVRYGLGMCPGKLRMFS